MKLTVIELFAGVGGFRLGLEGLQKESSFYSAISNYTKEISHQGFFKTGFSNQWEPSTKRQIASEIYEEKFDSIGHTNISIEDIKASEILEKCEASGCSTNSGLVLVGGFPCQDYSVANSLKTSKGIQGKKGVLWWEIFRLLDELKSLNRLPEYVVLENVDRLLSSPATARGRDFAIMLSCLNSLGYVVEYQIINASDLGFPQRRKRVFITAYKDDSILAGRYSKAITVGEIYEAFAKYGILGKAFPSNIVSNFETVHLAKSTKDFLGSLKEYEKSFTRTKISPFGNSGVAFNGSCFPFKLKAVGMKDRASLLSDILQPESEIPSDFYVDGLSLEQWRRHKGAKKIERIKPNGEKYFFSEGAMSLSDSLDKPSRTIITSEGGKSPSRTKHLIERNGKYRRLTPIELERLNMFPDNHTYHSEVSDAKRAFLMGNALVVGVIEKIRNSIIETELT